MGKSFEESFSFYLSYHSNKINQLIHIICVWPILFSAQIMFLYLTPINNYLPESVLTYLPPGLIITWSLLGTIRYAMFYSYVEQPVS